MAAFIRLWYGYDNLSVLNCRVWMRIKIYDDMTPRFTDNNAQKLIYRNADDSKVGIIFI